MNPRSQHIIGLFTIIALQIGGVWSDDKASLANKIATSVITILALIFTDPKKHEKAVTIARAAAALVALVVVAFATKATAGSVASGILTTAGAVAVRLQAMLPDSGAPSRDTPAVVLIAISLLLGYASCSTPNPAPTPKRVGQVVIQCAQTACNSTPPGPCQRLIASSISCLVSQGNIPVCLGGLPALVQVGYADVVCVVDALNLAHPEPEIREEAARWLRTQDVVVVR